MLTDKERVELEATIEEIHRRIAIRSLYEFAQQAWPILEPKRRFVPGWHLEAVCEHLEAVIRGDIRNLIINVPPRHMKSLLVSVLFPAWVWIEHPEKRWLFSSYAQHLSKRDSIKCRRLIESSWYQNRFKPNWKLAGDQNEKMRFENTEQGCRIATSVGGTGTGEGGDFIVCDDPHKATEIYSTTIRQRVLDWWDEEMSTRGNDPETVSKIIIMQRLHAQDLTGHLIEQGGYETLVLPAEYDSVTRMTSIGWIDPRKKQGDLLWPERFSAASIKALKTSLGSFATAGQLQQQPKPLEGGLVKRNWIKFWNELPARFDEIAQSWDLSNKMGDNTDFTVGHVWGKRGGEFYLIDRIKARMGFPEEVMAIKTMSAKHPKTFLKLVEEKANGFAVIQHLSKEIPGLVPYNPKSSKEERLAAVSPLFEAGNIYFPDPSIAPWVHDTIEEIVGFPNEKFDDEVDAATQILLRWQTNAAGVFKEDYTETSRPMSASVGDSW